MTCRPRPTLVDLAEHQVRVTQHKVKPESFLRPLQRRETDEVAPKRRDALVIGDGKFRTSPGLLMATLAASTVSGRHRPSKPDALRISQSGAREERHCEDQGAGSVDRHDVDRNLRVADAPHVLLAVGVLVREGTSHERVRHPRDRNQ